jgi:hypothetical protein
MTLSVLTDLHKLCDYRPRVIVRNHDVLSDELDLCVSYSPFTTTSNVELELYTVWNLNGTVAIKEVVFHKDCGELTAILFLIEWLTNYIFTFREFFR